MKRRKKGDGSVFARYGGVTHCISCGLQITGNVQRCPRCGNAPGGAARMQPYPVRDPESRFCVYCGAGLMPQALFCVQCGKRIE